MFPNIETVPSVPKEINIFKNYINEQSDPIRREIFSYSLTSYVLGNIAPFPIDIEFYYNNCSEEQNLEEYINFLALNYLMHKLNINASNIKKAYFKSEDIFYTNHFIKAFFDYEKPVKDKHSEEKVWIYPKKDARAFIANSFFNKSYNNYFYRDFTLIKLIMIMAGFSRYEISNLDGCTNEELKQINYPTLILANIGLYEKEFIKIKDDVDGISVFLDANAKGENEKIFTIDKELLKRTILSVINKTEKLEYTMNDFI